MSGRRGFLALIGGAGAVTGSVLFRKTAAAPTLILPPDFTPGTAANQTPPNPAEVDAINAVRAGLSPALFLDWIEGGLRMVEDCKPGGGAFGAIWRDAYGDIPEPPRRFIGSGGRTPHEEAHLQQAIRGLKASLDQQIAWSNALPIRRGNGA